MPVELEANKNIQVNVERHIVRFGAFKGALDADARVEVTSVDATIAGEDILSQGNTQDVIMAGQEMIAAGIVTAEKFGQLYNDIRDISHAMVQYKLDQEAAAAEAAANPPAEEPAEGE